MTDPNTPIDPVLAKRARASELANLGKRLGYSVIGIAIVVFAFGAITRFEEWMAVVVTTCMVLSAVFLVPAVIVGYGVSAANREERNAWRVRGTDGGEASRPSSSQLGGQPCVGGQRLEPVEVPRNHEVTPRLGHVMQPEDSPTTSTEVAECRQRAGQTLVGWRLGHHADDVLAGDGHQHGYAQLVKLLGPPQQLEALCGGLGQVDTRIDDGGVHRSRYLAQLGELESEVVAHIGDDVVVTFVFQQLGLGRTWIVSDHVCGAVPDRQSGEGHMLCPDDVVEDRGACPQRGLGNLHPIGIDRQRHVGERFGQCLDDRYHPLQFLVDTDLGYRRRGGLPADVQQVGAT